MFSQGQPIKASLLEEMRAATLRALSWTAAAPFSLFVSPFLTSLYGAVNAILTFDVSAIKIISYDKSSLPGLFQPFYWGRVCMVGSNGVLIPTSRTVPAYEISGNAQVPVGVFVRTHHLGSYLVFDYCPDGTSGPVEDFGAPSAPFTFEPFGGLPSGSLAGVINAWGNLQATISPVYGSETLTGATFPLVPVQSNAGMMPQLARIANFVWPQYSLAWYGGLVSADGKHLFGALLVYYYFTNPADIVRSYWSLGGRHFEPSKFVIYTAAEGNSFTESQADSVLWGDYSQMAASGEKYPPAFTATFRVGYGAGGPLVTGSQVQGDFFVTVNGRDKQADG